MKITYHGHSCVQLEDGGTSILFDPFLTPAGFRNSVDDIRAQYILLTHGHFDHVADAVTIAKNNDATIIATHELATYMGWQGAKTFGMNLGGSYRFPFGRVKMTQAFHSSSYVVENEQKIIYTGMPGGFVVEFAGKTVYHAGDTGLFGDMKLIGERHAIDVAFLPIGDTFTMGPEDAALAAQWVKAKLVIPIHYNTFPVIQQDPARFTDLLQAAGIEGRVLKPGETTEL
ncbi:MAG: metal-dependent hydrolase [Alicyclobacillus macrosporangiidus]|uniref:metal-dependent hydrolase n=1 Tax=Alicyclobacillus macrosporangiidus TaxID=392015 RepID=UPI0026EB0E85|nr:metal-dependent hydrolase [Alicyclobacillus macrosporangiidus]MCL6601057.1 metal-dependent hydrolase [Alicyclobacillus macrosporangiidus]